MPGTAPGSRLPAVDRPARNSADKPRSAIGSRRGLRSGLLRHRARSDLADTLKRRGADATRPVRNLPKIFQNLDKSAETNVVSAAMTEGKGCPALRRGCVSAETSMAIGPLIAGRPTRHGRAGGGPIGSLGDRYLVFLFRGRPGDLPYYDTTRGGGAGQCYSSPLGNYFNRNAGVRMAGGRICCEPGWTAVAGVLSVPGSR